MTLRNLLGAASADPEIHANFIASNAPDTRNSGKGRFEWKEVIE